MISGGVNEIAAFSAQSRPTSSNCLRASSRHWGPPICDDATSSAMRSADHRIAAPPVMWISSHSTKTIQRHVWTSASDIDSWCCGDAICSDVAGENSDTCATDCGGSIPQEPVCGSNGCELGENCVNCSVDCGICSVVTSCNNNGNCEPGETKSCEDCQISGFCKHDNDCPATNGNTYVCVNDTCILNDLPGYSTTCGNYLIARLGTFATKATGIRAHMGCLGARCVCHHGPSDNLYGPL